MGPARIRLFLACLLLKTAGVCSSSRTRSRCLWRSSNIAVAGGADVEGRVVSCLCIGTWASLSRTLLWMCHNVALQESLVGRVFFFPSL